MKSIAALLSFVIQRWVVLYMLLACLSTIPAQAQLTALEDVANTPATQKMHEQIGQWTFTPQKNDAAVQTGRLIAYLPRDWDGKRAIPMLIFLHGAGARTERGDTINTLYDEFFPKLIRQGKVLDAIVLCPQVSGYWGTEGAEFIDQAVSYFQGRFDPARLYLTGLSSGGGGTWRAAVLKHDLLAAAVPVCGIRASTSEDAKLVSLPIWAFHNVHDPYQKVSYTQEHIKAIRDAGGKYVRYTEYGQTPGKSHPGKDGQQVFPRCHPQAWEAAYTDESLWKWLFTQRRGQPELALIEP